MPNAAQIEGALQLLRRLRAGAMGALDPARAEAVGSAFSDAYRTPGAYAHGPGFAPTQAGLERQFGVRFGADPGYGDYSLDVLTPPDLGPARNRLGSAEVTTGSHIRQAAPAYGLEDAVNAGLIRDRNAYHLFDTVGLDKGSGQGERFYGAAYGNLARDPYAYNLSSTLTPVNRARRSLNMSAAIGRDPSLGERLILAPSQLPQDNGNAAAALVRYHALPPESQIGALQLMASYRAAEDIGAKILRAQERARLLPGSQSAADAEEQAYRLSDATLGALSPGVRLGPEAARRLAEAYQGVPSGPFRQAGQVVMPSDVPLGERTARKLMLTNRALTDGVTSTELGALAPNLEYRRGGTVAQTPRGGSAPPPGALAIWSSRGGRR